MAADARRPVARSNLAAMADTAGLRGACLTVYEKVMLTPSLTHVTGHVDLKRKFRSYLMGQWHTLVSCYGPTPQATGTL